MYLKKTFKTFWSHIGMFDCLYSVCCESTGGTIPSLTLRTLKGWMVEELFLLV